MESKNTIYIVIIAVILLILFAGKFKPVEIQSTYQDFCTGKKNCCIENNDCYLPENTGWSCMSRQCISNKCVQTTALRYEGCCTKDSDCGENVLHQCENHFCTDKEPVFKLFQEGRGMSLLWGLAIFGMIGLIIFTLIKNR